MALLTFAGTIGGAWLVLRGALRKSDVDHEIADEAARDKLRESLMSRIDQLQRHIDVLEARVTAKDRRIVELEARVAELESENTHLKARLERICSGEDH